jgi:hypothetical protein
MKLRATLFFLKLYVFMTVKIMTPYNLVGDHHTLKVEPEGYSETLVRAYHKIRCHTTEDKNLNLLEALQCFCVKIRNITTLGDRRGPTYLSQYSDQAKGFDE